ncbi:protein REVEILLE 6-like [Ricinus communis]|uniref:protein REVEILLE 6-like n=1 Tax=Ricinus communis TaxID=3988 RepID=UPI0007728784|nr:protein REVEILLE 6-like [Ricinus communis]|eukprot:XP_015584565.1 protein REVEILLE 6-like [Ricinus communis]
MVSVNPNPAQGFHLFDPMSMGLPGLNSLTPHQIPSSSTSTTSNTANATGTSTTSGTNTMASFQDDLNKKIRKPYTITKSRESWTEQEHDKFLEALQLFDRDWKKIEAFVGSKTVIQIRSHAQKYFLKVQKNGTSERVPPPRPKRKAAHPYPQKAPKNATPVVTQMASLFQSPPVSIEPGYVYQPDSSSVLGNPVTGGTLTSWSFNTVTPVNLPQVTKDDVGLARQTIAHNCCCSSTNESTPRTWQTSEIIDPGDQGKPMRVMPDFAQVYSFIGSVFDPHASGHLQRLKQMDPINMETVMLLMRNLSINLTSPKFEDHRRLLASYDINGEETKSGGLYSNMGADKIQMAISAPKEVKESKCEDGVESRILTRSHRKEVVVVVGGL